MKFVSLGSYEKQQQQQQQQQQRQRQQHTTQATHSFTLFPPLKKPPPLLSSVPFPPTPVEIAAWKKARQGLVSSSSSALTSASAVSPALPPRSKTASHAAAPRHDADAVTDQNAIVRGGLNTLQRSPWRASLVFLHSPLVFLQTNLLEAPPPPFHAAVAVHHLLRRQPKTFKKSCRRPPLPPRAATNHSPLHVLPCCPHPAASLAEATAASLALLWVYRQATPWCRRMRVSEEWRRSQRGWPRRIR